MTRVPYEDDQGSLLYWDRQIAYRLIIRVASDYSNYSLINSKKHFYFVKVFFACLINLIVVN